MARDKIICRDCNKRKEPENKGARCPGCLAVYRKKRAITWCKVDLAPTGEIDFCCMRCGKRQFFENHRKPIPDKAKDNPIIDRMAASFRVFKREHRRSGVPAKQPKLRKKSAVAS